MGHQLNFYTVPAEMSSLEGLWRGLGPMCVLHGRSPSSRARVVASSDLEENSLRWLFFALVRRDDLESVVTKHVPAQDYWTLDVTVSPVVELSRCFFDGRVLRRGRLYFVDGYYGASRDWVEKPEAFKSWGRALLATTRKNLLRHGPDYIGREAQAWLESSDGRLVSS